MSENNLLLILEINAYILAHSNSLSMQKSVYTMLTLADHDDINGYTTYLLW